MKLILILSALLLLFTIPAFSELTVADLEKIGSIVAESEKRLKEDIVASEKRLEEEIASVKAEVAASEKRLEEEIASVKAEVAASEKRLKEDIVESESTERRHLTRNCKSPRQN